MSILGILGTVFPIVDKAIDRLIPDKNEQERMKQEIRLEVMKMDAAEQKAAADIVLAEAQSEHKWTAMWRPLLMYWLMLAMTLCIVAGLAGRADLIRAGLEAIPPDMWTLIQWGMGGYIGIRGAEKVSKNLGVSFKK